MSGIVYILIRYIVIYVIKCIANGVGAGFHPCPQNKQMQYFIGSGWNPTPTVFENKLFIQITIYKNILHLLLKTIYNIQVINKQEVVP